MTAKDEKAERLAAALRENLRKRKQRGREKAGSAGGELSAVSRKIPD